MTEQELTDDIKDTLEVMNKLYRGYIEQDEKELENEQAHRESCG